MIAGASWTWWIGFHAVVAALMLADSLLPGSRRDTHRTQTVAWLWTAFLLLAAISFAAWISVTQGRQPALEWVGGYAIETSLSVDNLFVFMVIFQGFRIGPERQHKALLWGVAGAVVLRAIFIAAGITLLRRFDWIPWVFGLILLYAAWRLVRANGGAAGVDDQDVSPAPGLERADVLSPEHRGRLLDVKIQRAGTFTLYGDAGERG